MKKIYLLILVLQLSANINAKTEEAHRDEDKHDDHHEHSGGKAVGPGKAIEEVSEAKGFKLSPEAITTLKVQLQSIDKDQFAIKKDTLVTFQNKTGIYRFREGFFKFLPVTIMKQDKNNYFIQTSGFTTGDKIVTHPVGLIRITDVYSTDTAEYGHGH